MFILTSKAQLNRRGKDGKNRSHMLFFLNGVLILKQKLPYDTDYRINYQHQTSFKNVYLLNDNLYQTRVKEGKKREVHYPLSKELMKYFNVAKDLKIQLI